MPELAHLWGADLAIGPAGDLALVAASDRGQQRVLRRLLTNPGDYIWQPDYGAGLAQFIGQPGGESAIRAAIRGQIFKEDAVARTPEPMIDVQFDQHRRGIRPHPLRRCDQRRHPHPLLPGERMNLQLAGFPHPRARHGGGGSGRVERADRPHRRQRAARGARGERLARAVAAMADRAGAEHDARGDQQRRRSRQLDGGFLRPSPARGGGDRRVTLRAVHARARGAASRSAQRCAARMAARASP